MPDLICHPRRTKRFFLYYLSKKFIIWLVFEAYWISSLKLNYYLSETCNSQLYLHNDYMTDLVSAIFFIWITLLPTRHYLNKSRFGVPFILKFNLIYIIKLRWIIPFVTFSSVIHSVYTVYTFCCKQHKKKYPTLKEINSGIYILTPWYWIQKCEPQLVVNDWIYVSKSNLRLWSFTFRIRSNSFSYIFLQLIILFRL